MQELDLPCSLSESYNPKVVIKQLRTSSQNGSYRQHLLRFQREANVDINHHVAVKPQDCFEEDGQWFIIMPFIEGKDLAQYMTAKNGKLSQDESVTLVRDLAECLAVAHAQGIVHRDIKPQNIIIDAQSRPHLLDFGICRILHEQTICCGTGPLGSPEWMSPEQVLCRGLEDHRTDLYALGAILYYMLTGNQPAHGATFAEITASVATVPPSPHAVDPSIAQPLSDLCMKLLEKNPDDLFQSAHEFLDALDVHCGMPARARWQWLCLACGGRVPSGVATCPNCMKPFSPEEHRLVFAGGPLADQCFLIPQGQYIVGRDALAPRERHLSRRHFQVCCVNGTVIICDLGSANGTYINGRNADKPTELHAGVEVTLAGNIARYRHT